MDIEKLATSAVDAEISKTDRLSSYINSKDKEPCWDGHIYIHEDSSKTKKNIKRVATQVKGKLVRERQVKRTISYSISYDDLHAYMMDGGTLFFVAYLNEKTGDPFQVYFADLLPIRIKELLKVKKNNYSVKFRKFPTDKVRKTEIFINFYDDALKQASFAGKDLPTIDELAKKGVLESLSIHYTGLSTYESHGAFPKLINGQPLTVYANIKGGTVPVPVEYYESVSQVTMSNRTTIPITVDGKPFYTGIQTVTTADQVEYRIGSSVKLITPNTGKPEEPASVSLKVRIQGTLRQRIAAIKFVIAMIEHGSFNIGSCEMPAKFPQSELDRIRATDLPELLKGYEAIKSLLDSMHVTKDLAFDDCTDEDVEKLNLLLGTIGNKKPVKAAPESTMNLHKMKIANLTLAVVYLPKENGGYYVYDYFGKHFDVTWAPNGSEPVAVSQFLSMEEDDFLTLDNLYLDHVVADYKRVSPSSRHLEFGNQTMLAMLKAHDKKPSGALLVAARSLCDWQQEHPEYIPEDITTLNRMQITLRERELSFGEKAELAAIVTRTKDEFLKIGAFLLLDEQSEAKELLDALTEDERKRFMEFPIYKFYRHSEEETDNG